jgi:transcription elongation factor GreA
VRGAAGAAAATGAVIARLETACYHFESDMVAPGLSAGRALPFSHATMLEALKAKLGGEVEKLQHELNVTLPAEIRRAVEMGDLRENSEYKAALERQQFVQARLGQLRQRLSKLSAVDMSQIPEHQVGLGSTVVVEDQRTGQRETYRLIFGDAEEFDESQVTMSSPIGRALINKAVGEETVLKLPTSTRRLKIVELQTIHDAADEVAT